MADTNINKDINKENIINNNKDEKKNESPLIEVKGHNNHYNNQMQQNSYNNNNNNCCYCFYCSENLKCALKIIFFPCFCLYQAFGCFWDNRCEIEPYYHSGFFIDNVIFCILSVIDLVFVIIYKGEVSTAFLVIRIISDSLGMLVLWMALGLWSEEASDEDHMDPAFFCFTVLQGIATAGLDIASLVIFFTSDFKSIIILIIFQIIHLVFPIVFPFIIMLF